MGVRNGGVRDGGGVYGNLKGSTHSKPNVAFHVTKSLRVGGQPIQLSRAAEASSSSHPSPLSLTPIPHPPSLTLTGCTFSIPPLPRQCSVSTASRQREGRCGSPESRQLPHSSASSGRERQSLWSRLTADDQAFLLETQSRPGKRSM